MAGISETKEVVELGLYFGKALKGALEDGKLALEDLVHVMTFMPQLGPAFENIGEVPKELGDMDDAESKELVDLVKSKLPEITADERAQNIASAALKVGLSAAMLVAEIQSE